MVTYPQVAWIRNPNVTLQYDTCKCPEFNVEQVLIQSLRDLVSFHCQQSFIQHWFNTQHNLLGLAPINVETKE